MHVFVYGTLTNPTRVEAVVDSYVFVGSAVLEGLHAVDGRYPTLAPGGDVAGRLLRTGNVAALDEYEGVEQGLYTRTTVPGGPGLPDAVTVYVGNPDELDAAVSWPGDGPFRERVQRYLDTHDVRVRSTE